ncbi:MAG: M18 family aminopeptidase [Clostridia bacterium]|nr:M18 family aminopeptidase [Clostridia bacterium]
MQNKLYDWIDASKTAYNAVECAVSVLKREGFTRLSENESWNVKIGGKHYVVRDGSALIAFTVGEKPSFQIVASHCDSPCFKLKGNPAMASGGYLRFNVEKYGGGIFYTYMDTPLTVAGRICVEDEGGVSFLPFVSEKTFVIPSLAIHFNREVNGGVRLNPQKDMCPLASLGDEDGLSRELEAFANGKKILDSDLFLVSKTYPFDVGYEGRLFCSPRIDNLTSVFASVEAVTKATPAGINVAFIADNEEIGSRTKQGAGSTFLYDTLYRIALARGLSKEGFLTALADSFMVSSDNAHAAHPNFPELSDPTTKTMLGGGVVIKHHAQGNYTTDAFSSALFKHILDEAGVKHQDMYVRSDLPCGGTLGTISSSHVSVRSVDIGIAELSMHSCVETASLSDYEEMVKAITKVYSVATKSDGDRAVIVEKR